MAHGRSLFVPLTELVIDFGNENSFVVPLFADLPFDTGHTLGRLAQGRSHVGADRQGLDMSCRVSQPLERTVFVGCAVAQGSEFVLAPRRRRVRTMREVRSRDSTARFDGGILFREGHVVWRAAVDDRWHAAIHGDRHHDHAGRESERVDRRRDSGPRSPFHATSRARFRVLPRDRPAMSFPVVTT